MNTGTRGFAAAVVRLVLLALAAAGFLAMHGVVATDPLAGHVSPLDSHSLVAPAVEIPAHPDPEVGARQGDPWPPPPRRHGGVRVHPAHGARRRGAARPRRGIGRHVPDALGPRPVEAGATPRPTTAPGSQGDLDSLGAAGGAAFDRMFLEMMIVHHEGAVAESEREMAGGANPQAKELASQIISGQTAEIERMRELLG